MFLNAAKSFASLTEEVTDSLDFELMPHHIEQAGKLERKVNNRVKNVFKLAFASVIRDVTEAITVSEVRNDDTFNKETNQTLKYLQESEDLKGKQDEKKQWKKLKEDLSWFVIYNEKLKTSIPHHFKLKGKRSKIMDAKGIYYRNILLKKNVNLQLVRWFKKRMGIKVKKSGYKIRNKLHVQKYKLMKPVIVRRLLKDIIACGYYSFMRERLIDILYDRRRKQLNKMKKAEKKYKSLVKFYQQKLAEANKFAVARRKIRERLIQLKILRIKTDVKTRIFKHLKRLGFSTTREADDFHMSTMKQLQRLQKTGVSSTDHLVHFKSLNSDTFLKTIVLDLVKQGKITTSTNNVLGLFNLSTNDVTKSGYINPWLKYKKKQQPFKTKHVVPLLKTYGPTPIQTEAKQTSAQPAHKFKRSIDQLEMFTPKLTSNRHRNWRRGEKNTKKKSGKIHKTLNQKHQWPVKMKNISQLLLQRQSNVITPYSTSHSRKNHRKKRKLRLKGRSSMGEKKRIKYPTLLKENKLKTCTVKLAKTVPRKRLKTVRVMKTTRGEVAKRRIQQSKYTGKSIGSAGQNSDQLSTKFYKGFVDSLRSMVSHKSSIGSASNHTDSDNEKLSDSLNEKSSVDQSARLSGQAAPKKMAKRTRKQLATERIQAEKKRLEKTVLRSVVTRFKEMMMDVPKDKDFRLTNILGGFLARHAWRRFYTGKSSPSERVIFQMNSRNKRPPWGHYRLYKPLTYNRKIKYYLVVHGFDLTPRKFKSKRYPPCPLSFDVLWFFSNILRDSKNRRNRMRFKFSLRKESVASQSSGSYRRFTIDEKSLIDGSIIPHLLFREEDVNSQETEDDDVPMMFTKRHELQSTLSEDRQTLQFRILLKETETIDLLTIESLQTYNLLEMEASFVFHESYKPEKKLSKLEMLKKRKKRNFFDVMTPKIKESRENLSDMMLTMKQEKSIIDFEVKTFENRGVQVVKKTCRTTKVQVNAPTRKNASTLVTLFDFTAETNKEKTFDLIKSIHSKNNENEGSETSSDDETERKDDPLIITKSSEFKDALAFVQRILASNIYKKPQMFYARYHVDPLSGKLPISYECVHLWTFHDYRIQLSQMIVNSIAPHPFDTNIIAVAYAKNELATRDLGIVCIWNIKNIFFPEQVIKFTSSITYIEFSHPSTISVSLMGGFVAVIDISKKKHRITMNTERTTTAGFLPIWQFSWFSEENGEKFPVSCGADGRMYRYRTDETFAATILFEATPIENKLRGVSRDQNGFHTGKWKERPEMTACAQHPTDRQSYLVGTSEGTVHICSLLLRNHLEVFAAQQGRISKIMFHPHCEHVFLTVGGDFSVRIWAIGIFEPLLTYSARNDYMEDASFNEIWPELMVSISAEFVDIWNIRRKVCVPVQSWSNPKQLKNTCIEFSTDGYSVIVGDIGGYVHSFRLSEMPCESKMKAEVLSQAIMSTLSERQDLIAALSKLGYPFSVTYIENFLKSGSSRKSEVV